MAKQPVKNSGHEAGKTNLPVGTMGSPAPDLTDVLDGETPPKPVDNTTVGAPRAEEFKNAVEEKPVEKKPAPLPPTAEIADFSPDLGSDVLFWQEEKINDRKLVLVPIPGKLVHRNPINPDLWRVMLFLPTGKISDRLDVRRSDRPQPRCWTMKS